MREGLAANLDGKESTPQREKWAEAKRKYNAKLGETVAEDADVVEQVIAEKRQRAVARKSKMLENRIKQQETALVEHTLKAKVENLMKQSGIEGIDMESEEGKAALEKLRCRILATEHEIMPTLVDTQKDKFLEIEADDVVKLDKINNEYKAALPPTDYEYKKPIFATEPVQVGKAEVATTSPTPLVLLRTHGLDEVQVQVLSVLTNPDSCIKRYGDVSKVSIAKFLKIPEGEIVLAFNRNLLEANTIPPPVS